MEQRASFGRKAIPGYAPPVAPPLSASEPPAAFARPVSRPDFAPPAKVDFDSPWFKRLIILLLTLPLLILFVDSLFSGTELITPIDHGGLVVMRSLGAVDGLLLWFMIRTQPAIRNRALPRRMIVCIACPLIMMLAFDSLSWRLANWGAFGFSDAPFETATYPIKAVDYGRKGRRDTVEIDPFKVGESSHLPLPSWQYSQLREANGFSCVTVQQRRSASGAIQVRTDGQYVLREPAPLVITTC